MKKNKIKNFLIILCSIFIVAIIASFALSLVTSEKISLKANEYTYEYGENFERDLGFYLANGSEEIEKNSKFIFNVNNQTDRDYPAVGTYTGLIKYKGETAFFRVKVRDTTVPEFVNFKDSVSVSKGTSKAELASYFNAKDLSPVKISVDGDDLDLNSVRSYDAVVVASDSYGNASSRNCTIVVTKGDNDDNNKKGLASSGSYTNSDGILVNYEDYYSYEDAVNAMSVKEQSGYIVTSVVKTTYNGKTVYRYEYYKEVKDEPKKQGLANNGSYNDSNGTLVNFEDYYDQASANSKRQTLLQDSTLTVSAVTTTTFNGDSVYRVTWYVTPQEPQNPGGEGEGGEESGGGSESGETGQ